MLADRRIGTSYCSRAARLWIICTMNRNCQNTWNHTDWKQMSHDDRRTKVKVNDGIYLANWLTDWLTDWLRYSNIMRESESNRPIGIECMLVSSNVKSSVVISKSYHQHIDGMPSFCEGKLVLSWQWLLISFIVVVLLFGWLFEIEHNSR